MNTLRAHRDTIRSLMYADESLLAKDLLARATFADAQRGRAVEQAQVIVKRARERRSQRHLLEVFVQEFGLSSDEGVALLGLAEALLRIPDVPTADNLIAERIRAAGWQQYRNGSSPVAVKTAAAALLISGRLVDLDTQLTGEDTPALRSLLNRASRPVVRAAMRRAITLMGGEFVLGRTIEEALTRAGEGTVASFDMLGEGARTRDDARRHFHSYLHAIRTTGASSTAGIHASHGVSVKLSALHPRYEHTSRDRAHPELLSFIKELACKAGLANIHLTIDAEEAARLDVSLDLIESLARDPDLAGWNGLGLALQCYSKRAPAVLEWLIALARETRRRFMVRLVKGAYWDTEVKRAQELGTQHFPVFTRKAVTDVCYLACARRALSSPQEIYPQFATHNAHTIAAVVQIAGERRDFEFQRLHGMGELLYSVAREVIPDLPQVRVYAPVGSHEDLLAYLVRRLLENGANTSFVNQLMDERVPVSRLTEDPLIQVQSMTQLANPDVPLPSQMLGARLNSTGLDIHDPLEAEQLLKSLASLKSTRWTSAPIVSGQCVTTANEIPVSNPANRQDVVGHKRAATAADCEQAMAAAVAAQPLWDRGGAERRAQALELAAEFLEAGRDRFVSLLIREAGKTAGDGIAEVREAVDFCRYYAGQARRHFGAATELPGPTGEKNLYSLHGRGAFVCISPWNFPLAIFIGQVTAALAAGNSVLAKPAEQTTLIAAEAVSLLHEAGVPADVLHLVPGSGQTVGKALVSDERIAGVVMTGSTVTAKIIARALADRAGALVPLIAETGGQNAMFVDSTALPEQVVDDVIRSAFHSAGQRCSALRVLYLQEEIAERVLHMIKGAMDELRVGDPAELRTDVGPVIDEGARKQLTSHVMQLRSAGLAMHTVELDRTCENGTFVAPHLFEITSIEDLEQEHFGPILHVVRYRAEQLDTHLTQLRATGYGLTLGVQTRIEAAARRIFNATTAGNTYVNRNMIGAVVGVQPFGGHGLSGTGPKAGGPLYLQRFATERVLTINTAAAGGNVELLRAISSTNAPER